ncbi:hypothetical protein IEQ11_07260 [Lysobacter capsici]|uniref:hypothetical protein n=1 Tax=Lysobacter capsici TaxID=435897 RepID=UPI00177DBD2F|nr:hypothetical protein [Lysobacter capsici]UOF16439.1 hypothetical protein IEQ11_07260 [Lysobacter capsici]
MSHDTPVAPGNPRREIAAAFGEIANTLDWNHHAWLALMVKLENAREVVTDLTLAEVVTAINQVHDLLGDEVQS